MREEERLSITVRGRGLQAKRIGGSMWVSRRTIMTCQNSSDTQQNKNRLPVVGFPSCDRVGSLSHRPMSGYRNKPNTLITIPRTIMNKESN
ncbi:MAG: hypothetical protein AUF79_02885 [Crenarchaeota archaeon 13_1_20CM_2_51_8]|nr:MAG: hypothetical protein AUF79_02885 [Crenarchaeota archaeon 13_1_20CM_2_51_8]